MIMFRRIKGEQLLKLSIGAPSSPSLCNILLFEFDKLVDAEARKRGIIYTRYADDLTFSGQRVGMLKDMIKVVQKSTRDIVRPRLTVNSAKTTFITASRRRVVTGVTLANDGALSLGRDRKRLISAQVHHASLGKLSPGDLELLAGQLAFANVVENQL
ncbi:reverse transcriptase domain-containing protein, partial [Acidisphaera sp. S103]|uniref:reverse transcriptase domain-containing protein n=1 Tax=Acidisphaera sp. S103 TaxID=1747223 RepID=UPI0020B14BFF